MLVNLFDINFQPFKYQLGLINLWSMGTIYGALTQLISSLNSINLASISNLFKHTKLINSKCISKISISLGLQTEIQSMKQTHKLVWLKNIKEDNVYI